MEDINFVSAIINICANISTLIGVVIAALSLISVRKSFHKEQQRQSKESTINFFHGFKRDFAETEKKIHIRYHMNPIDMNEIRKDDTFWIEIKNYLSQLEQLSVGIRIGIYDFDTADHLSGGFFVNTYVQLKSFINEIRTFRNDSSLYIDYQNIAEQLMTLHPCAIVEQEEQTNFVNIPDDDTVVFVKQ